MKDLKETCKVAVIQAAPVLFNREETVRKAVSLIHEAGKKNVDLIIFPETFIPCYPRGFSFGNSVGNRTMEGRDDYNKYYDNAVIVPSEATDAIAEAAQAVGAYVGMGITERDLTSCTLYCTYLIFSPEGKLVGKHRKTKPTGMERCMWGDGHEGSVCTVDTDFGRLGVLICWENYMPLARAALYQKGISIYLAPTADGRESWQNTMKHIALEGRCFVIGCNQAFTKSMYPSDFNYQSELDSFPENIGTGGSCIVTPYGEYVAEPVFNSETILYGELDMGMVPKSRMDFDPSGHYVRPDIYELIVHEDK